MYSSTDFQTKANIYNVNQYNTGNIKFPINIGGLIARYIIKFIYLNIKINNDILLEFINLKYFKVLKVIQDYI